MGKLNVRILVVTGSNECASQYMTYMNVFFTAQKRSVVIDVCALDKNLSLLQQGCDITGGQYLKVPQLEGLLQYLLVKRRDLFLDFVAVTVSFLVGLSAGPSHQIETGPSTGGSCGLSSGLFLP